MNRCAARKVWQRLSGAIEEVLDGVTLEDLVGREAKARSKLGDKKKVHRASRRTAPAVKRSGAASRRPGTKAGKK